MNIKLAIGETHTVTLHGLGTAGYSWDFTLEGDSDVVLLEEESTVPAKPAEGSLPQTFEAQIIYTIKAVKPGKVSVYFFLHRVWEKNKQPLKEEQYFIEVAAS